MQIFINFKIRRRVSHVKIMFSTAATLGYIVTKRETNPKTRRLTNILQQDVIRKNPHPVTVAQITEFHGHSCTLNWEVRPAVIIDWIRYFLHSSWIFCSKKWDGQGVGLSPRAPLPLPPAPLPPPPLPLSCLPPPFSERRARIFLFSLPPIFTKFFSPFLPPAPLLPFLLSCPPLLKVIAKVTSYMEPLRKGNFLRQSKLLILMTLSRNCYLDMYMFSYYNTLSFVYTENTWEIIANMSTDTIISRSISGSKIKLDNLSLYLSNGKTNSCLSH